MNKAILKPVLLTMAIGSALVLGGCKVEKTDDGELPKVDVKGGDLPNYNVETADVDVNTREATVTVPEVDVKKTETTVPVPNVDVTMPDEKDRNDQ